MENGLGPQVSQVPPPVSAVILPLADSEELTESMLMLAWSLLAQLVTVVPAMLTARDLDSLPLLLLLVGKTPLDAPGGVAGLRGERPSAFMIPPMPPPMGLPEGPFPPLSPLLCEDDFCWARRSCFRNLARRFWNHTWKQMVQFINTLYCIMFMN